MKGNIVFPTGCCFLFISHIVQKNKQIHTDNKKYLDTPKNIFLKDVYKCDRTNMSQIICNRKQIGSNNHYYQYSKLYWDENLLKNCLNNRNLLQFDK